MSNSRFVWACSTESHPLLYYSLHFLIKTQIVGDATEESGKNQYQKSKSSSLGTFSSNWKVKIRKTLFLRVSKTILISTNKKPQVFLSFIFMSMREEFCPMFFSLRVTCTSLSYIIICIQRGDGVEEYFFEWVCFWKMVNYD